MIRRSLAAKIGVSIVALILLVSVLQFFALDRLLKNAFNGQAASELLTQAQQYANMSAMGGTMMMQMLCNTADASLVMVNPRGKVVAASPSLRLTSPNTSDQSAMSAALHGGGRVVVGYSRLFRSTGILAAVPIQGQGGESGAVLIFRPEGAVQAAFRHVTWLLLVAGVGGVLVALGLVVILSRRIANPLQRMALAAKTMTGGDYSARVPVIGQDEVGTLGEAINELAVNLNRLDTSRKVFLSDVAHELRTPMTYIRGYSQVLNDGLANSEEDWHQYVQIIHDESTRLETLVNDLFVLAQADSHALAIDKQATDMGVVTSGVVDRMRHRAEEKGINLSCTLSPIPNVSADRARMEQVLVNLLDNAIRYTPAGGSVRVSVKQIGKWVELDVSDTGIGIPQNELPHIWERMYRVEKSRARVSGGSGLGLAIVKHIVEAHDGHVSAASEENQGTTITVQLPLDPPQS
ncbi:ATP-binding protein [Alicyclobacillus sp. ALC3]|uniref:ATP-binding protein n=1 Tax=Alicyclobacillus sp. ALC3 TaxID=2796143 RepID=UPI0023784824|nr:ATP-binding protein [Alicyclobacillus sp. ALC3]WDL98803.1 HAMP domain-containing protein [Alicyclobacillus sp. ALC3]